MKRILTVAMLTALAALWTVAVLAAVPQLINFQGILKDGSGNPVADGSYSVAFSIYDAPSGGNVKWSESQSVSTTDGLFSVLLGSVAPVPDSVFNDSARWLGIQVGADPEMTPRQQLVSVGYAFRVAHFIPDSGMLNTFIGPGAGNPTTTGNSNTASGANALAGNTSGYRNTANGALALFGNTTGYDNTASGSIALQNNTTGGGNTASGIGALANNTTSYYNTACGALALYNTTTGSGGNTACGTFALTNNSTGSYNTAIGFAANVLSGAGDLINATAIGNGAIVDASNKIRLGNAAVTVIEGQVAYTFPSDKNEKENFRAVDGEEVLRKIQGLPLSSWNYKGHDPKQFRHYGPMAQDFFAAFGNDGVGKIGTETTLNSGDVAGILMIAVQALGNENAELKAEMENLKEELKKLRAEKPKAEVR